MDYVIVTTDKDKRGVFAGFLKQDQSPDFVILTEAKMCVYWDVKTRGVVSLATKGPSDQCRISYSVLEIKLFGVTAIIKCSEDAISEWKKDKWKP